MIAGLIEPSEGEILLDGQPIGRDPISHRERFGCVSEEPQLYPRLTAVESPRGRRVSVPR